MTDVQALLRQLADPNQSQEAFKTLYHMGASASDALLAAIDDPSVAIRSQVATLLGSTGDSRAIEALMTATRDNESRVRRAAIAALGKFERDARVPDFLRELARRDGDMTERAGAVFALAQIVGKPTAAELWLEMLNDPSPQVVGNAASQLGTLKLAEAVDPLMATLNRVGEQSLAFMPIMLALGDLGDSQAFDTIAAYLKSTNPHKRVCAAAALGRLGDVRGIAVLEPLLKDKAVAGQEDHGGPNYTVSDTVRSALETLRKKHGMTADTKTEKESKPRWKFW